MQMTKDWDLDSNIIDKTKADGYGNSAPTNFSNLKKVISDYNFSRVKIETGYKINLIQTIVVPGSGQAYAYLQTSNVIVSK